MRIICFLLALLLIVSCAGCFSTQSVAELEGKVGELEERAEQLSNENDSLVSEKLALESENAELDSRVFALNAKIVLLGNAPEPLSHRPEYDGRNLGVILRDIIVNLDYLTSMHEEYEPLPVPVAAKTREGKVCIQHWIFGEPGSNEPAACLSYTLDGDNFFLDELNIIMTNTGDEYDIEMFGYYSAVILYAYVMAVLEETSVSEEVIDQVQEFAHEGVFLDGGVRIDFSDAPKRCYLKIIVND